MLPSSILSKQNGKNGGSRHPLCSNHPSFQNTSLPIGPFHGISDKASAAEARVKRLKTILEKVGHIKSHTGSNF